MKWIKKDDYYIESEDGIYTIAKCSVGGGFRYILYKGNEMITSADTARELMEKVKLHTLSIGLG
jgi:hypothetical protein